MFDCLSTQNEKTPARMFIKCDTFGDLLKFVDIFKFFSKLKISFI